MFCRQTVTNNISNKPACKLQSALIRPISVDLHLILGQVDAAVGLLLSLVRLSVLDFDASRHMFFHRIKFDQSTIRCVGRHYFRWGRFDFLIANTFSP